MTTTAPAQDPRRGDRRPRLGARARRVRGELPQPRRGRRRLRRLPARREGRRPVGRRPRRRDRRAVGGGHDGPRLLGDQGHGRDDAGPRPLARLARLRRAGRHLLARVRARPARSGSPSASCSPTRPASSASTSKVDRAVIADPDRLAGIMARQRPEWEPGERQAYHAISLGFYEGELLRRVDPQHRTLGRFFAEEIAGAAGRGLPRPAAGVDPGRAPGAARAGQRRADDPRPPVPDAPRRAQPALRPLPLGRSRTPARRCRSTAERVFARELEIPSGGGVGTARALARAYAAFAGDGRELGLRPETLADLRAPAIPPRRGFHDECMRGEVQFSLGFMKPTPMLAVRPRGRVRLARRRRLARLRRPGDRDRVRVRDEPDGPASHGDPRDVALRRSMPQLALVVR